MKKSSLLIILIIIIGGLYLFLENRVKPAQTVAPYVSIPVKEGISYLDPAWQKEAAQNLTQTQKLYESYDDSTELSTRLSTLLRIYGYQESLWLYSDAKKTLESSLALQVSANTLRTYALLISKTWDIPGAIVQIDKAIALSPTMPDFWNTKLDFLRILNKDNLKSLDSTYLDALVKTNNSIDMVAGYAHYLELMGEKSDSIKYYKQAIKINPEGKSQYQDAINRQL